MRVRIYTGRAREDRVMRVYEAIVKALEGLGVEAAFGGPGENDATLLLALKHSTKIKSVIVRNEQAASFMACGYAMFTRRLGVCFATAGPGAFNLFSGLAVALTDSHPVLAISGFSSLEWKGKGALNETSGLFRTPDSQKMFEATTKRTYFLNDAGQTCDMLEDAVNTALAGRPGPVHIHVPENLTHPGVEVDDYHDIRLNIQPVLPDAAAIAAAAAALADAIKQKKPIVALIGFGAVASGAGPELQALVERFQIPFITTLDGKGIIRENHPLCLGITSDAGNPGAREAFNRAQVVLAVGNSFAQHATYGFYPTLLKGKTLIHVNIDRDEINKVYPAQYAIVSDAKPAIAALCDALGRSGVTALPAAALRLEHAAEPIAHVLPLVHPGQMVQSLSKLLPDNSIVLADAGTHAAWLAYYLELSRGQNFRKPGSFGPMACAVNGGIGAKCAEPQRTVVVGCGDGCYLMAGFELVTAVQYNIPVIWIIFNDGEFKLIKLFQLTSFHESGLVDFQNPDYAAYARACGALGYRVESLTEFENAFQEALASGRPTVIDAAINRLALPHYSPTPHGLFDWTKLFPQ
jgi:acetolactate synthase-1/2/3 large subunit